MYIRMGPVLHILRFCFVFRSYPLVFPLPLSHYCELSSNLISVFLLWCHYCFCHAGPQFLVAQDQQLCIGPSIHVNCSCTENPQDMDADGWLRNESAKEQQTCWLHSGFPKAYSQKLMYPSKDFDRPWSSGDYLNGRIQMFGNLCRTLGYCLALWVPASDK